jgi:hypothetical protein
MTRAIREGVPGAIPSLSAVAGWIAAALGLFAGVTWLTAGASPFQLAESLRASYFVYCVLHVLAFALVPLAAALFILRPGFTTRPAIAGLLAGCGAGLVTEAGWRLFCHASDPRHVLTSHLLALTAVSLIGSLAGTALLTQKSGMAERGGGA